VREEAASGGEKAYLCLGFSGRTIAPVATSSSELFAALERLAPLQFAEPWDNVGLLLEPATPATPIKKTLLTIDLTEPVLNEALELGVQVIVAYHPPIFSGLKRLRGSVTSERVVVRCLAAGLTVFSPHTALDAAPLGINDWLLDAFEPFGFTRREPCLPHAADPRYGQGRMAELARGVSLNDAVQAIKQHLGLPQLRVSAAAPHAPGNPSIRRVAVCAGAGGSVFEKLSGVDLFLTGEMRHHDVRSRGEAGSSVVLCDHTNTERGFLPILAERLAQVVGPGVSFHVSTCDRDPLAIV
jgi:dinuclear metal center YbgI/SA1388 family protein